MWPASVADGSVYCISPCICSHAKKLHWSKQTWFYFSCCLCEGSEQLLVCFCADIGANAYYIIKTESGAQYKHNRRVTPIVFVNIRAVSQKWYILTRNYVLHDSKWAHSPICQYCFEPTSPLPFLPLHFKGKERGRWVQLVEISQNKLSNSKTSKTICCWWNGPLTVTLVPRLHA